VEEDFDFPAGAGVFPPHAPRSRSRGKPVPEWVRASASWPPRGGGRRAPSTASAWRS